MKKMKTVVKIIWASVLFLSSVLAPAQTTDDLSRRLMQLTDVTSVRKIENHAFFKEAYEINISQFLDHKNPAAGKFTQRVILSHFNPFSPIVLVTEGYSAEDALSPKYINELSRIIEANQLVVEHRYFGKSTPENINWNYLTVENACNDLHRILNIFKKLYNNNKWIATGISKGGHYTLAYKAFYPNDVNIWIPYVAGPFCHEVEDGRFAKFLEKVGPKSTRDKIQNFQLAILQNRELIQPLLDSLIKEKNMKFRVPNEQVLDYCVLEYPFSFWQWGEFPHRIPEWNNNPKDFFTHLVSVIPPGYFEIEQMKSTRPFFIQAAKELGYYSYNSKILKDYLLIESPKGYLKRLFLEENEVFKFNNSSTIMIEKAINKEGSHVMLIYGEYDPYTASAIKLSPASRAKKFVIAKGDHRIRIENLTYEQKAKIYMILENWLDE